MKTRAASTVESLIERKRRKVERAEEAHAAAHAKTRAAERARIDADRRWLAALDAAEDIGAVMDLDDRALHVRALRRAVDVAEQHYAVARMHESALRQVMTDARVELRRFEAWVARKEPYAVEKSA